MTKSPQTGLYLFCITGGKLGPAIKRSGFDVIVLTGRAEEPVYVEVAPDGAKTARRPATCGASTPRRPRRCIHDGAAARR